ncbi:MAG: response regulator [Pyrinomonadaceae bacterium]|nr:response regulator [Pyrinomonadaceae bacterium]
MSKRKLLLADDSITIQKVVNLTFADEGIEVISVSDGDSAMQKLTEITPDLVMADVHMPGISGYQMCEKIRESQQFGSTPVILLVGSFEPFDEEEAKRVGADDYLTKPFQSIRQLVSKVTTLLEAGRQSNNHSNNSVDSNNPFVETPILTETPVFTEQPISYEETVSNTQNTSTFGQIEESISAPISTGYSDFTSDITTNNDDVIEINNDDEVIETFSDFSSSPTNFDTSNLDDEMIQTSYVSNNDFEETELSTNLQTIENLEVENKIDDFATTQEMSVEEIQEVITSEKALAEESIGITTGNFQLETEDYSTDSENDGVIEVEETLDTFSFDDSLTNIPKESVLEPQIEEKASFEPVFESFQTESSTILETEEKIENSIETEVNETGFDFVKPTENVEVISETTTEPDIETMPLPDSLSILDIDELNPLDIAPREEDFVLSESIDDEELLVDDIANFVQPNEKVIEEKMLDSFENEEVYANEIEQTPIIETESINESIAETNSEPITEKLDEPIVETEPDFANDESINDETNSNEIIASGVIASGAVAGTALLSQETIVEEKTELAETVSNVETNSNTNFTLTDDMIELIANRVVQKLSERVVREIAWEIVPQHADLIIKKMVEDKLKEN